MEIRGCALGVLVCIEVDERVLKCIVNRRISENLWSKLGITFFVDCCSLNIVIFKLSSSVGNICLFAS